MADVASSLLSAFDLSQRPMWHFMSSTNSPTTPRRSVFSATSTGTRTGSETSEHPAGRRGDVKITLSPRVGNAAWCN